MEELALKDYLNAFIRQKKYFFLTFAILFAGTIVYAMAWSNYRSMATVEIQQPEITRNATSLNGSGPSEIHEDLADLRIGKIRQKVTTVGSLAEVITKFNLYPEARKTLPIANVATRMLGKIKVDLLSSAIANPAATQKVAAPKLSAIAFNLSFDYSDPQAAQKVTEELVTRFLDEDIKEMRSQAHETSEFLASQIEALDASLAEQEKKIKAFQETHGDLRPENLTFNQQAYASAAMSLQSLESQIVVNESNQGTLRAQLAGVSPYSRVLADGQVLTTPEVQLKALKAQYASLTAQYGPEHPDVVKTRNQMESLKKQVGSGGSDDETTAALQAQIADMKTNLQTANKTLGAQHPDLEIMRNKLKKLQAQLVSQDKGGTSVDGIVKDADNPAYLAVVAQIRSAEEQHKALLANRDSILAQQQKYQTAVEQNPAVMQQMAALTRDYDNAQLRYRELKERKMAADMDEQMVQERKGQRLVLINPPDLPIRTQPARHVIILAGFVLSIVGGMGSAVVAQLLRQSILSPQHLASLIGAPPLVAIPRLVTGGEKTSASRRKPYIWGGLVVLVIGLGVIFSTTVMTFDRLWIALLQKLGLA